MGKLGANKGASGEVPVWETWTFPEGVMLELSSGKTEPGVVGEGEFPAPSLWCRQLLLENARIALERLLSLVAGQDLPGEGGWLSL